LALATRGPLRYLSCMDYQVKKAEKGQDAYYTVPWTPIVKADKYDIVKRAPALPGVIELYFMDSHKKLNLFYVGKSWYGGIRSSLRCLTDPELEKDERRRAIVAEHEKELYYRFALCDSNGDMDDIVFFFMATYSPGQTKILSSGRYEKIYLEEIDEGKLVTI
jgi:hypothetical protein